MTKNALVFLVLMALGSPAVAEGGGFTFGGETRQHTYPSDPSDPQYQYSSNSRKLRCPKGQAPFQGRCRIKLPVR
jgi:hypothetical protein